MTLWYSRGYSALYPAYRDGAWVGWPAVGIAVTGSDSKFDLHLLSQCGMQHVQIRPRGTHCMLLGRRGTKKQKKQTSRLLFANLHSVLASDDVTKKHTYVWGVFVQFLCLISFFSSKEAKRKKETKNNDKIFPFICTRWPSDV